MTTIEGIQTLRVRNTDQGTGRDGEPVGESPQPPGWTKREEGNEEAPATAGASMRQGENEGLMMNQTAKSVQECSGRDMADRILSELEAGTGREELRRMLIAAAGRAPHPPPSGGPAEEPTAPRVKSTEDDSQDLKALRKAARSAGELIHGEIEKYNQRVRELEDTLRLPFSPDTAMIAALVIIHAVSRTSGGNIRTRAALIKTWEHSMSPGSRERFVPTAPMAARLLRNIRGASSEQAVRIMTETAGQLTDPASVGELMQRLIPGRKKLAAYHTREASAILMARLAIPNPSSWPGQQAALYRMADYSCGTGTLLRAAAERVRELARNAGENPALMHRQMMEQGITAIDLLPASVAVAAAELDALEERPASHAGSTGGITLRYGPIPGTQGIRGRPPTGDGNTKTRAVGLGAMDLFRSNFLNRQDCSPTAREGQNSPGPVLRARSQNLVIMNPPFTKEAELPLPPVGSTPPTTGEEREILQSRMKQIRSITRGAANNGRAYDFAMLAHRMVATGGTIALLLQETALTGSGNAERGWPEFRRTLTQNYRDIRVVGITAFEEKDSTFSHDTRIPEVILIARKKRKSEKASRAASFINISRRPQDNDDAARISGIIQDILWNLQDAEPGKSREVGRHGMEITGVRADLPVDGGPWQGTRVVHQELNEDIGELWTRGNGRGSRRIPTTTLGEIARIGTDKAILDRRARRQAETLACRRADCMEIPALIKHQCDLQRMIETDTNGYALIHPDSPLRLSRLHINSWFRYNSQSPAACMTRDPSAGGKLWPTIGLENEITQKVIALWMNTTPGLRAHWRSATRTQHGMGCLSSRGLREIVVLDPKQLSTRQLEDMEELFEETRVVPMLPANEAWRDEARIELDRRMMEILDVTEQALEEMTRKRNLWCHEPTVVGRKGGVRHRQPDMEQLWEMVQTR